MNILQSECVILTSLGLQMYYGKHSHAWESVSFTILSNSLLFCLAVRFSLKWRDDKHELHILYFWLCIMHDPQSFVRVGFLQRIWTISHQTTGEQEEGQRESQQNPPVTVSFSQKKPLSVLSLANESLWLCVNHTEKFWFCWDHQESKH